MIDKIKSKIYGIKSAIYKKNRCLRFSAIKSNISPSIHRSVICNNCVGAMVLNDFGLKFNSPFVNLFITAPDYVKMLRNLEYYCNPEAEIENITNGATYPKGLLQGEITLHFLHYDNFNEAVEKWRKRCKRIDYCNLYVIFVQQASCGDEELKQYDHLSFKNSIVLVNRNHPDLVKSNSYVIKGWENEKTLGRITDYVGILGRRYYDQFNWRNFLSL